MTNFSIKLGNNSYKRVTKNVARKHFDAGEDILIKACNLRPDSYGVALISDRVECTFDTAVNAYMYYNCNRECGNTVQYFVKEA